MEKRTLCHKTRFTFIFNYSSIINSDIIRARCMVKRMKSRNCLGAAISNFSNADCF